MKNIFSFNKNNEVYWWSRVIKVITYGGTIVVFGFALFFFFDNSYQLSTRNCVQFKESYFVDDGSALAGLMKSNGMTQPHMVCEKYSNNLNWDIVLERLFFVVFTPILWFLFMRFGLYESFVYIILGNKKKN